MGRFLDALLLEHTGQEEAGRAVYRIARRFRYEYGAKWCGGVITVPAGFLTDLSSVPKLLWILASPQSGQQAATLHDYLYSTRKLDRAIADAIFRAALADAGVGPIRRWWMWAAVRLFGGSVYRKNNPLNISLRSELQEENP